MCLRVIATTVMFVSMLFSGVSLADENFKSQAVSLVYPEPSKTTPGIVSFIVRGNSVTSVKDFSSTGYLQAIIDAIKQADPVDWQNSFKGATANRKIHLIDVSVTDKVSDDEAALFTNHSPTLTASYVKTNYNGSTTPNVGPTPAATYPQGGFTDKDGNTYDITTQILFNPNPQGNTQNITAPTPEQLIAYLTYGTNEQVLKNAADLISHEMYTQAKNANVTTIYYIHCTQGKDRTGFVATWYLLNSYLMKTAAINNTDLEHLAILGEVFWSSASSPNNVMTNFNKGKDFIKSNIYPYFYTVFNKFNSTTAAAPPGNTVNWKTILPANPDDLGTLYKTMNRVNWYAGSKPLCGADYTFTCMTKNGNTVSWNNSSIAAEYASYDFYLVYVDANGYTIGQNYAKSQIENGATPSINLDNPPTGSAQVKIYAFPHSGHVDTFTNYYIGVLSL